MDLHKAIYYFVLIGFVFLIEESVYAQKRVTLDDLSSPLAHILGDKKNGKYLFVTAGDHLYSIGNQQGDFLPVGFHVPGEMGGIWQHPIKLFNSFSFRLVERKTNQMLLPVCDSFISYPFSSKLIYSLDESDLRVVQTQFIPDRLPVLVVEYKISNNSNVPREVIFRFNAEVNLMPVWLSERIGIIDGKDRVFKTGFGFPQQIFKDEDNQWFGGIGCDHPVSIVNEERGNKLWFEASTMPILLQSNKSLIVRFYLGGSSKNAIEVEHNLKSASKNFISLFREKNRRYLKLEETARINIPDSIYKEAYNWGKYNTDWLVREVPGLGRGLSAGLPDYPWFFSNDQARTFAGLAGTINPQLFFDSYKMLEQVSEKANGDIGRIIHEVSSNGVVFDRGRMEESQLFIITAWDIYKWTGDENFLKNIYALGKKTWLWLLRHENKKSGYIQGAGGVEIKGLDGEVLDVQVYTYWFLEVMEKMAIFYNEKELADSFNRKAILFKNQIKDDWWMPSEFRFADFISDKEKAIELINGALEKRTNPNVNLWAIKWLNELKDSINSGKYIDNRYLVFFNNSTILPFEAGIGNSGDIPGFFKNIDFFTNRYGLYTAGIDRPDSIHIAGQKIKNDTNFTYTGAIMPASTARLAILAAKNGMPEVALKYIHAQLNSFSYATPGTTYEISPDRGMFLQAWNITGLNIPLIKYFFGINPMANDKMVVLNPVMPKDWNFAEIKNLLIGNTKLSMKYYKEKNHVTILIHSSQKGWKIRMMPAEGRENLVVNQGIVDKPDLDAYFDASNLRIEYDLNQVASRLSDTFNSNTLMDN